jgi:hypothetical protein
MFDSFSKNRENKMGNRAILYIFSTSWISEKYFTTKCTKNSFCYNFDILLL